MRPLASAGGGAKVGPAFPFLGVDRTVDQRRAVGTQEPQRTRAGESLLPALFIVDGHHEARRHLSALALTEFALDPVRRPSEKQSFSEQAPFHVFATTPFE
jgi:hypothetical protein